MATAEAVLAQVDGKPERVVHIMGEMGGRRAERAIIMLPKLGKPDDPVPGRWMARELGPVPEGEGWIGVERRAGVDRRGDRHRAGYWTPK